MRQWQRDTQKAWAAGLRKVRVCFGELIVSCTALAIWKLRLRAADLGMASPLWLKALDHVRPIF